MAGELGASTIAAGLGLGGAFNAEEDVEDEDEDEDAGFGTCVCAPPSRPWPGGMVGGCKYGLVLKDPAAPPPPLPPPTLAECECEYRVVDTGAGTAYEILPTLCEGRCRGGTGGAEVGCGGSERPGGISDPGEDVGLATCGTGKGGGSAAAWALGPALWLLVLAKLLPMGRCVGGVGEGGGDGWYIGGGTKLALFGVRPPPPPAPPPGEADPGAPGRVGLEGPLPESRAACRASL